MSKALTLLLKNINLFPFSAERAEFHDIKAEVLLKIIENTGYTSPETLVTYIKSGDIQKMKSYTENIVFHHPSVSLSAKSVVIYAVAYMYALGLGTKRDIESALKWLGELNSLKFKTGGQTAEGLYQMAQKTLDFIDPALTSYHKAMELYREGSRSSWLRAMKQSVDMGYPPAQVIVAIKLRESAHSPDGLELATKVASMSSGDLKQVYGSPAIAEVTKPLQRGEHNKKLEEAFALFKKVAILPLYNLHAKYDSHILHAIIRAQTEMAEMLLKGMGVPANPDSAIQWTDKAMETIRQKGEYNPNKVEEKAVRADIDRVKAHCPQAFKAFL